MKTILIIGAGRMGGLLAQELIRASIGRVVLASRSERRLEGMVLSLRVFASVIESKTIVDQSGENWLSERPDLVVVCIKDRYDPRELLKDQALPSGLMSSVRTIGVKRDLPLLLNCCRRLSGYSGRIAVLSNPVDVFSVIVKRNLPNAEVIGLGLSVDSARLSYVAHRAGITCRWTDCPLGGIHIGKLVPLRSIWNRSSAIAKLHPFRIDELVEEAGLIGPAIVRGLGFTLHDCVSVFVNDLRWLVSGGADGGTITCSLATLLDAVGCPIGLDNSSGLLRPTDYRLNDAERSELVKAKMVVREFVERILRNGYFGYEGK